MIPINRLKIVHIQYITKGILKLYIFIGIFDSFLNIFGQIRGSIQKKSESNRTII